MRNYRVLILVVFFCANFLNAQYISEGNYYETIGGIKLHYTIRGKGPVMLVRHTSSGKIGYELTLKPLEKIFYHGVLRPQRNGEITCS